MVRLLRLLWLLPPLALGAAPTVALEPTQAVLGETVAVSIRVSGLEAGDKLQFAASQGELLEDTSTGTERRFTWTPPDSRIPAIALLLFWVEQGEQPPEVGVARLPLIGRTQLEVATEPGAEVKVQLGGRTFGPVRADPDGRALVPIEVPPGVFDAKVLGQAGGKATELTVPLGVPAYNPLFAIVGPDPLYSQGKGWLWVFDASEHFTDKLSVALRGGDAREVETTRRGTLFTLTPAARSRRLTAVATARNSDARAEISVKLVPGRPPRAGQQQTSQPQSPVQLPSPALVPAIFVGGFFSGGANLGLGGGLSAALHLVGPLSVEGELGLRRASLTTPISGLGELGSVLLVMPLSLGARARVLSAGPWSVDVRGGGGALPFIHSVSSTFQPTATETGVGWEAFVATELSYALGGLEVFLELRGAYSAIESPQLSAQPGGLMLSLGARRHAP